jgi:multidrug resistance efflux pump
MISQMSIQLGRKLTYAVAGQRRATAVGTPIGTHTIPWRRYSKFALGAALIAIAAATTYQQVLVRVSREAVINARVATIRAPMDGIVRTASAAPGRAVQAGAPIGDIEDPTADDARVFQLQQDLHATEREHDVLAQRLADLRHARTEADDQADAYRIGRVQQDQLRVEETRANFTAAMARQSDAIAAERRGAALNARGYMANSAYESALHAREVAQQDVIAARKRLDALTVE